MAIKPRGSGANITASAIIELNEQLIGAKYRPIAYLGSQKVKGTNFAVLAEQKILDADNTKNIVLVVFNEAPHNIKATLVYIKPVLNGFLLPAGGIHDFLIPLIRFFDESVGVLRLLFHFFILPDEVAVTVGQGDPVAVRDLIGIGFDMLLIDPLQGVK